MPYPDDRSRGVGQTPSPRCPAPSTARRHAGRAFPTGLRDRSHCTAAARFAFSSSMLDTRSGLPIRHPACCPSGTAPHSNSTLTSQPVPARAGVSPGWRPGSRTAGPLPDCSSTRFFFSLSSPPTPGGRSTHSVRPRFPDASSVRSSALRRLVPVQARPYLHICPKK